MSRAPLRLLPFLLAALAAAGCSPRPPKDAGAPAPARREELASGRIALSLEANPPEVSLDRPLYLTLTLTAPATVAADWPALDDRFEGFEVAGSYEAGARLENGRQSRDLRVRLTPLAAPEYRLKPMAVAWRDTNTPQVVHWVKTKPVVFPSRALAPPSRPAPPEPALPVRLSAREFLLIGLVILVGIGLLAGAWIAFRKLALALKLRQMSPRQRALYELNELLKRHLVEQGLVKEFYFELTLVVRRYIERRHGIRAPEQTTEEFLASASADPRFPREALPRLQEFLIAADWVKYADYRPMPEAVPQALDTARRYVESDEPEKEGG